MDLASMQHADGREALLRNRQALIGSLAVASILAIGGVGVRAATPTETAIDGSKGIFLEDGAGDIRMRTIIKSQGWDGVFSKSTAAHETIKAWFNKPWYVVPTAARPSGAVANETEEDFNELTSTELEAGLKEWFPQVGNGNPPTDADLEEFDEIVGMLQSYHLEPLANPVFQKMLDDGYTAEEAKAAVQTGSAAGLGTSYRGLVFGRTAVKKGMSLSRAVTNIHEALKTNPIGCTLAQAKAYLTHDYGNVKFTFWQQKKEPMGDVASVRYEEDTDVPLTGDLNDKYNKFEVEFTEYQPATSTELKADFYPGTKADSGEVTNGRIPFPEPFDPGAKANADLSILRNTDVHLVARCEWDGKTLQSQAHYYVENYRPVDVEDLNFTGTFMEEEINICNRGGDGVCKATALPYSDDEGGEASLELGDTAQVNSVFKAIVELGDGINGYVRYHPDSYGPDDYVMMYFMPPTEVGSCTNRFGTRWMGPGISTIEGNHASSLILDMIKGQDLYEDLSTDEVQALQEKLFETIPWYNPPDAMRGWLDELLLKDDGSVDTPQGINESIKAAAADALNGGTWPYGEWAPYSICDTENGKIMKVNLQFNLDQTPDPQSTGIFKCGDIPISMNYTQESPVAFLYEAVDADHILPEKMPKDQNGTAIPPNGEGVYLEASSCCDVTSIVGGGTLEKHDDGLPNGQISVIQDDGNGNDDAAMDDGLVRITAGVINDNGVDEPVGQYNLLYPSTRVHSNKPIYCGAGQTQGVDCKGYGQFSNQATVLAYAPHHPDYQGSEYDLRSPSNPVDQHDNPFMSLQGSTDPTSDEFQKYIQGHRYEVTIAAWDNTAPLVVPQLDSRGVQARTCYPIDKLHYRLFRREASTDVTIFEGDVITAADVSDGCVDKAPSITLTWVPRADGFHYWEVEIKDTQGNERKMVSEVEVYPEGIDTRGILSGGQRSGE
jgi:hypothetical protein